MTLQDAVSNYLFTLQDSGLINMWGCPAEAQKVFCDEDPKEVEKCALYWMENYQKEKERLNV